MILLDTNVLIDAFDPAALRSGVIPVATRPGLSRDRNVATPYLAGALVIPGGSPSDFGSCLAGSWAAAMGAPGPGENHVS